MAGRIRLRIVWKRSDFVLLATTLIRIAQAQLQAESEQPDEEGGGDA
jgi:hypothetical protein